MDLTSCLSVDGHWGSFHVLAAVSTDALVSVWPGFPSSWAGPGTEPPITSPTAAAPAPIPTSCVTAHRLSTTRREGGGASCDLTHFSLITDHGEHLSMSLKTFFTER